MLVAASADHELPDVRGTTPLLKAAIMQNRDWIVELASHGAHVESAFSKKWRESHFFYVEKMRPFVEQAKIVACKRTRVICILLEDRWVLPKVLSQLIAEFSNTEWHDCAELGMPYVYENPSNVPEEMAKRLVVASSIAVC